MDEKTLRRFWAKVNKNGPVPTHMPGLGPCWEWTACCCRVSGYGVFHERANETMKKAHRVSWKIAFGTFPDGFCLHRCDNRRCVRPDHLFEGDHAANAKDREQKGRGVYLPGERNGFSRLTEAQVLEIRSDFAKGTSKKGLAARFSTSRKNILDIISRKTWRHI